MESAITVELLGNAKNQRNAVEKAQVAEVLAEKDRGKAIAVDRVNSTGTAVQIKALLQPPIRKSSNNSDRADQKGEIPLFGWFSVV